MAGGRTVTSSSDGFFGSARSLQLPFPASANAGSHEPLRRGFAWHRSVDQSVGVIASMPLEGAMPRHRQTPSTDEAMVPWRIDKIPPRIVSIFTTFRRFSSYSMRNHLRLLRGKLNHLMTSTLFID